MPRNISWWRHQMETFSVLLAICAGNSPVPGEFPAQRPVTRSFDVFFDLCSNKRLSKQSWGWWFETPSCPLWRHRNVVTLSSKLYVPSRSLCSEDQYLLNTPRWCLETFGIRALHDDVIKLKHFPRYWPFVRGIHRSPVNSPHKGQLWCFLWSAPE